MEGTFLTLSSHVLEHLLLNEGALAVVFLFGGRLHDHLAIVARLLGVVVGGVVEEA